MGSGGSPDPSWIVRESVTKDLHQPWCRWQIGMGDSSRSLCRGTKCSEIHMGIKGGLMHPLPRDSAAQRVGADAPIYPMAMANDVLATISHTDCFWYHEYENRETSQVWVEGCPTSGTLAWTPAEAGVAVVYHYRARE